MQKQSPAYTWRDEAWAFVDEGSLALDSQVRDEISAFYRNIRSGKEAYSHFPSNSARKLAAAPFREAGLEQAKTIIPALEAVVSRVRTATVATGHRHGRFHS